MTTYLVTIRHHSIGYAREIEIDGTLSSAKEEAAREFDDEFQDYEIAIYERLPNRAPELVATKLVAARKWQDR